MSKNLKRYSILVALLVAVCAIFTGAMLMTKPVRAANTDFVMKETAEVRFDTTGIRFSIDVNNEYLSNLTASGEYEGYTASLHAAIIPTVMLGGQELKADTQYTYNSANVDTLIVDLTYRDTDNSTSDVSRYNAVLTGIPSINYETDISARGFIKLVKAGETTKYIYTDVTAQRSIGEVATDFYNSTSDVVDKESAETLLLENLGTVSFAEDSITLDEGDVASVKILGNKYGFELDNAMLEEKGAVLESDSSNVTVNGYSITAVSAGSANLTITIGDKTATIPVTVKAIVRENDTTGKFSWKEDETTVVTRTNVGYEITATQGTVINYSDEITLSSANEFISISALANVTSDYKIRFVFEDALDANYGFSMLVYVYAEGDTTYMKVGEKDQTDYSNLSGWTFAEKDKVNNSLATTAGTMTYRVNSENKVQYDRDAYGWYNSSSMELPANAFSASNSAKKVKLSIDYFEASSATGILIKKLNGESLKIAQTVTDSTGVISWKENENISVEYLQSFTWTNSSIGNGNKLNPWTWSGGGYKIVSSGEFVDIAGVIDLDEISAKSNKRLIQFASTTLPLRTDYTSGYGEDVGGDRTFSIRLTDATDSNKVLTFSYYVDKPGGEYSGQAYMGFAYTNGTVTIDAPANLLSGVKAMTGYSFGNSYAGNYANIPELKYLGNYEFSYKTESLNWEGRPNTEGFLQPQLLADNFGANGVKLSVSSGTTGGMYIFNFPFTQA